MLQRKLKLEKCFTSEQLVDAIKPELTELIERIVLEQIQNIEQDFEQDQNPDSGVRLSLGRQEDRTLTLNDYITKDINTGTNYVKAFKLFSPLRGREEVRGPPLSLDNRSSFTYMFPSNARISISGNYNITDQNTINYLLLDYAYFYGYFRTIKGQATSDLSLLIKYEKRLLDNWNTSSNYAGLSALHPTSKNKAEWILKQNPRRSESEKSLFDGTGQFLFGDTERSAERYLNQYEKVSITPNSFMLQRIEFYFYETNKNDNEMAIQTAMVKYLRTYEKNNLFFSPTFPRSFSPRLTYEYYSSGAAFRILLDSIGSGPELL